MPTDNTVIPPKAGGRMSPAGAFGIADDFQIAPKAGARSAVAGDVRARLAEAAPRSTWRNQLFLALAASILAGGAAGWRYGGATGVRPNETQVAQATQPSGAPDPATLQEEVRSLRAQVEQFRHNAETQRAGETTLALAAKVQDLAKRLETLERTSADPTPVGSIAHQPSAATPPRRSKTPLQAR